MVKKLKDTTANENQIIKMVKDSAHQIWLAGLGAFVKTQQEGNKLFESLVQEGEKIESRTKKSAEEKLETVKSKVPDNSTWDKLEQVFENRVSRALSQLGVPTRNDVLSLSKRVEDLSDSVKKLIESRDSTPKSSDKDVS
jgi:poly(hydroxyalkanoate) granule-associated protein